MIKRYINPSREEWRGLCERMVADDAVIAERVDAIIERVREGGDAVLRALAKEIDGVELQTLEVSDEERREAFEAVPQELKDAIAAAARNITLFHNAQKRGDVEMETARGVLCVQRSVPIERVGLYIPGGTAPLFSTVLMLAIPAMVAGCSEMVLCTPTNKEGKVAPAVLFAAMVCGVHRIFKVGGAQAVAAMAYGTETIPAVDKIFGPGNRYVTKAKERVTSRVAIDMPAGPSEVLVLADDTAVPAFVASDLLSQAEHGVDSQALLVCGSEAIADEVEKCVAGQLEALPRKELAAKALENSRILVFSSIDDQVDFVNMYASEHLIISTANAWDVAYRIKAAGSIFIGNYSPESAGDYASGTNHTLPTSGWARSYSGVNLDSFMRKITYQEITKEGIKGLGGVIETMATAEGLEAHANAVRLRCSDNN